MGYIVGHVWLIIISLSNSLLDFIYILEMFILKHLEFYEKVQNY